MAELISDRVVFLTGGAGFVGTELVRRLAERNRVVVFDRLDRDALGRLAEHPNVQLEVGDVLDTDAIAAAVPDDIDLVLHLAAVAGVDTVLTDPVRTLEVNALGTFNVLDALRRRGVVDRVQRFVHFSTSEVLGRSAFQATELSDTSLAPVGEARWTYAVSKLAGEHLTMAYTKQYGLAGVIVRPFNIYGQGQIGEGAIHHFVVRAIAGDDLVVHGDGDQIRAWCHVDDMAAGVLRCLTVPGAVGHVFNIGNPRSTITVLELAKKIRDLAGSDSDVVHVPKPYVDVDIRVPSINKARDVLGFEPQVDLEDGLARTIEWYRAADR